MALAVLLACLGASRAQAADVPPELGLLVMLKVLTYDAGFETRVGNRDFVVLVPFAPAQADEARNMVAVALTLPIKAVVGRALRFEAVPVAELDALMIARSASAVLVPSGTPPESARQAAAVAAKHSRYSMTLDKDLVKSGITLGVALNSGKAQVILNVVSARAIKAEFSSAVMRVARIHQ